MPSQVRGSTWQHGCGPERTKRERERERGTHNPTLSGPLPLVHTRSLCPAYTHGAVTLKACSLYGISDVEVQQPMAGPWGCDTHLPEPPNTATLAQTGKFLTLLQKAIDW
ncbi:hypothetical protein L798_15248 [Zootermopsis nevadensis]|uniref:Uncharacterized protein n=1 Tax=Zootermopsis nevadensis TaxID=136037 RepID=A0A067QPQ0_ZOONE|nr:hypothetical protein L798_15248 [Zootermopsis nevadensis]